MPKASLRPYATIAEGLDQYLGYNFNRIENLFEQTKDTTEGATTVIGTATVATGLAIVDGVTAGFVNAPGAGGAYVSAVPGSSAGTIIISVYQTSFAASVIGVTIQWIAVGELVLN